MSAGRLMLIALVAVMLAGCASPRNHREAKSQNDKVSLVIMPVIVVAPQRDGPDDSDSSPSRDDDRHPRALLLHNLQYRAGPELKHVPETTYLGR
jgi:hypothetical protein